MINIDIPLVYSFLFDKARYKISYGGRAAGRSWSFIRALLIKSLEKKRLILCCREIQTSIKESVYRLLVEQIELLNLSSMFIITQQNIIAKTTGSEFIFKGLFRNINAIKSLEGIDICDIEEAETVSEESWKILLPTFMRKPGAEVWIKFNTRYVDDPTYQRFVVNPPHDSIIKFTTWRDNKYFSEESRKEKDQDFAFRPTEAKNIWDGEPVGAGMKIYPDFKETIHVKEFDIPTTAQAFMAMDPAMHYYPAALWLAQWPNTTGELTRYVYNEWPSRSDLGDWFHKARKNVKYLGSLADMSREIYAHDGSELGLKITKRGIDTRFAKGTGSSSYYSGDTVGLVAEFAKKINGGILFTCPWEKAIDMALNRITQDLQYNTLLPISDYNQPKLYIAPKCLNLIESLKNHRLELGSEKEDPKFKDFSDSLKIMWATFSEEKYKDPKGQEHKKPDPSFLYQGVASQSDNSGTSWMGM
jgi:phage terminase large subunit